MLRVVSTRAGLSPVSTDLLGGSRDKGPLCNGSADSREKETKNENWWIFSKFVLAQELMGIFRS